MDRRILLVLAASLTIAGAIGTALSPLLLVEHPLLLALLSPSGRHLALAAPQVGLTVLVAAATVRRLVSLVVGHGLGASYAQRVEGWLEGRRNMGRLADALGRALDRIGPPLLAMLPSFGLCALAGVRGWPARKTLPWAAAGTFAWVVGAVLVGDALAAYTSPLVDLLSGYVWEATAIAIVLVIAHRYWARRVSRRREAAAL